MGTFAAHPQDVDNLVNSFRVNNSIKYFSPILAGFRFSGLVALRGTQVDGGPRQVPFWSIGGDYAYHGLRVAAAYLYADQPAALFTGGDGHFVANTNGDAIGAAGPFSYIGHPDHMSIWGAGATYTFGATTLAGLYTRAIYSDANGTRSDVAYDNYDVSVRYMLTPAVKLFVGNLYTQGHVSYLGQTLKYDRVALGVDYALSKRTELYGVVVAQQAFGDAQYANIYYGALALMSTTSRQAGGRVGIVQKF